MVGEESFDGPLLRPLLHADNRSVIGYQVKGVGRGPRAVATGRRADASHAFDRLARIPSLPWIRGELILIVEEALDDRRSGITRETIFRRPVDGAIYLAFQDLGMRERRQRRLNRHVAYWSVLRLCVRLGMIRGRGVPAAGGAQPDLDEAEVDPAVGRLGLVA